MPKKKLLSKIIFHQITLFIIGIIIIILISIPLAKKISRQYKVNQEINDLEKEINDLKKKNLELNELLSYIESDQFIEEQARLKFNYKKEGEELVVIKNEESANYQNQNTDLNNKNIAQGIYKKNKTSNPYNWWEYFFNN